MAVTVRLYRMGKKHSPIYRIVVVHKRQKQDGDYIEEIGQYNPIASPHTVTIKDERLDYWVKNGAILSEGITKLLKSKIKPLSPKA